MVRSIQLKDVLIGILVFVILLFILEIGLRIFQPDRRIFKRTFRTAKDYNTKNMLSDFNWIQSDEALGWVCQQKEFLKFVLPEFTDISYTINGQGFRSSFDFKDTLTEKKKILLLGDSFLFGMYLKEDQTIVHKLQEKLGPNHMLYNVSVPGWGIDQMYLAYQNYINIIEPDLVVFLYIDEDMMRTLHEKRGSGSKPRLKIDNGFILKDESAPGLLEKFCWTNQISNRLYTRYMQWYSVQLSRGIFKEIISLEKSARRNPLFVHIPLKKHVVENDKQILFNLRSFFKQQEVDYVELADNFSLLSQDKALEMYLPNDGHFSESGAELTAQIIYETMLKSMPITAR